MKRRKFFGSLLASLAAAATLPEIATAVQDYLGSLKRELDAAPDERHFWERVRQEFMLKPGLIHFNSGSIGATPVPIVEAHKKYIDQLEEDPYGQVWSGFGSDTLDLVQQTAARFLRADADEVFLTRNTTEGMNLVATGMRLEPGDEILTTDHEHPGGMMCWLHMAALQGVRVRQIHLPTPVTHKDEILSLIEEAITSRTRVCSFSHVATTTGLQMPMADIAAITRPKGILLVCDGAQAPGMFAVDVKQLRVDAYASSSHKWMLAPKGTGLLYVRKEVQDRIRPVSAFSGENSYYAPYTAAGGTRNTPVLFAHRDTMNFHNILGRERVEQQVRQLNAYLRQRLTAIPKLTPLTPESPELSSAMASYKVKGMAVDRLYSEMRERGIIIKRTAYNWVLPDNDIPKENVGVIRLSTHIFNSEEQVDRLVEELADVLGVATAVEVEGPLRPQAMSVSPNYPNPFNASTHIQYQLPRANRVDVAIYNGQGQLLDVLQEGWQEAGVHQLTWNAQERASGTYFYRITAGTDQEVRKMLLLR